MSCFSLLKRNTSRNKLNRRRIFYDRSESNKQALRKKESAERNLFCGREKSENKVKSDLTIDTKHSQADGERLGFAINAKNRLYMLGYFKYGTFAYVPAIVVADRDTGRILYEGYISRKDNKALSNLMINHIRIN
jgi:hypothetical protein